MSWLPPSPRIDGGRLRLWEPPLLSGVASAELSYVLIDEIVGSSVGLAVSPWPQVDDKGRVRFPAGRVMLGANANALSAFLHSHRLPREHRDRELRIGDAFAVRARDEILEPLREQLEDERRLHPFLDPAAWMRPPVYDITADAREAAKRSFFGAVAPTLNAADAARLRDIVEPASRTVPLRRRRWPFGPGRPIPGPALAGLLGGAALLALGVAAGSALGRASDPETTVARTTITEDVTVTGQGATATGQGATATETTTVRVADAASTETVTESGPTVTESGPVTETVNGPPPPAVTIERRTSNRFDAAVFTFAADRADATFECRLGDAEFQACTSPKTYESLGSGTHVFEVRARDQAGTGSPASYEWDVPVG